MFRGEHTKLFIVLTIASKIVAIRAFLENYRIKRSWDFFSLLQQSCNICAPCSLGRVKGLDAKHYTITMKTNHFHTRQALLTLLLWLLATISTQAAIPQYEEEEAEELDIMFETMEVAAEVIGLDSEELFSALAHGLSLAQVATAHQSRPGDLIEALASYEESYILDMLLEEEVSRQEALEWREENWLDTTWFIHEEDPFGLADIMWLLDATGYETELETLELVTWLEEGESIASIAEAMETELEDVRDHALELLEMELDQLVILEELEEEEAEEWMTWVEEELGDMLQDDNLLENLAAEIWFEESIAEMAELLGLDEEELWDALEGGESLEQLIEDADIELATLLEEFGAEELEELLDMLQEEDEFEEIEEDFEETEQNHDF
jgi:hypothetical protein